MTWNISINLKFTSSVCIFSVSGSNTSVLVSQSAIRKHHITCVAQTAGVCFLTALEAGSPRSQCWQVRFHPNAPSLGVQLRTFLPSAHMLFRKSSLSSCCYKAPTLLDESPLNLNYCLKALSPDIVTLWSTVSTHGFGKGHNSVRNTSLSYSFAMFPSSLWPVIFFKLILIMVKVKN